MLRDIKQNDKDLLKVIQDYGCLFLCFANASPLVFEGRKGVIYLNALWEKAVSKGYISGDLNNDNDYDDIGEAEVLNHNGLATLFNLDVLYDEKHHSPNEQIPDNVKLVFGRYVWKFGHFVQLDKNKNVVFDSLGNSYTVKNGKLQSMRWYYAN